MRSRSYSTKAVLAVGFCLLWNVSAAHAENWVRIVSNPDDDPSFADVDVDSILKGDDGLVYYRGREDMGVSPSAVDCQKQIFYVIGDGSGDWKSSPYPIKPGTDTAKEADFVCSRA